MKVKAIAIVVSATLGISLALLVIAGGWAPTAPSKDTMTAASHSKGRTSEDVPATNPSEDVPGMTREPVRATAPTPHWSTPSPLAENGNARPLQQRSPRLSSRHPATAATHNESTAETNPTATPRVGTPRLQPSRSAPTPTPARLPPDLHTLPPTPTPPRPATPPTAVASLAPAPTPHVAATDPWMPMVAMQMQQLGQTIRQLDQSQQRQQRAIDEVVVELKGQRLAQQYRPSQFPQAHPTLMPSARLAQAPAPPSPSPASQRNRNQGASQLPTPDDMQLISEGDDQLTINVQDAEIRDVLELLSQHTDRNIVPMPGVSGKVTAFLSGVTLDEALDAILKSKGLVSRKEPKFVYIGTRSEMKEVEEKKEMRTRVYRPNYISAMELQQLITPLLTIAGQATLSQGEGGAGAAQPASGGGDLLGLGAIANAVGSAAAPAPGLAGAGAAGATGPLKISATTPAVSGLEPNSTQTGGLDYAGTDALVVRDYEDVLHQIDQIVKELDQRPRQVAIEAMILTVRLSDNMKLGVNFEMLQNKSHVRLASGQPLDALANLAPVPGTLKFGYLDSSINAFIDALENVGETNIVASPRLMCLNKQQAEILIGSELGFVNTTVTQTAATQSVEFLEVGTQLRFRPFITDDNVIRLELNPELSTGNVRVEQGLTLPDKEVTKVTTNILCRNGSTVIIGGLIREDLSTSVSQVPVLGSVPYVGPAFRRKSQTMERREIIVLITPRVVGEEEAHCEGVAERDDYVSRQELYRDKMSPLGKRQIGERFLRHAQSAWTAGDAENAFRYVNRSLHYNPIDRRAIALRRAIVAAHPYWDLPLRNRLREGLRPGERPHVNYPKDGVPWQTPAPVVSPSDYRAFNQGQPGRALPIDE